MGRLGREGCGNEGLIPMEWNAFACFEWFDLML